MCLIINRNAQATMKKKDFITACEINPDGYGIVVPDGNGLCTVIKELNYDHDDLWDLFSKEFIDDPVMLHLRYTTAGETIRRNLHPFPVLEYGTDGVDLWMAHNGTISDYRPTKGEWESDTRRFVRTFVRPLFKRMIRGMSPEELLTDPFIYEILDDKLSALSVLSFMDGFGNTLQVNPTGNGGKYEDGLWFSNTYSFESDYRTKKSPVTYGGYSTGQYWSKEDERWYDAYRATTAPVVSTDTAPAKKEVHALDTQNEYFSTSRNLEPEDIYALDDELLSDMVYDAPETALELIKELLFRCFRAENEVTILKEKKDRAERLIAELKGETNGQAA